MYDLISIGAIGIDFYFQGESLTVDEGRFQLAYGGKYFVDHFKESLGGGGANVAIGVQKYGFKTALLAKIAQGVFTDLITRKLKLAGVDHRLCQYDEDYSNISCILLGPKGERSIINYRTPHQHLFKENTDLQVLEHSKAVYLGNLSDVSLTDKEHLLRFVKKNDILTFVNLGVQDARRKKDQLEEFLSPVDVLIINGHEFADIAKIDYNDLNFKKDIVKVYAPYLLEKIVIVTEGEKGSYGYFNGSLFYQEALKPQRIVDTTGAGDGYTAGFIASYLRYKNLPHAMKVGAEMAKEILGKVGAN
ncbi:carbohydrate kinase family protein [Candidatus Roizmanbacteria bacterium]|nr:carbohydrate kinase family protein [Candidatus Roizmanbacteria bacterium]